MESKSRSVAGVGGAEAGHSCDTGLCVQQPGWAVPLGWQLSPVFLAEGGECWLFIKSP